MKITIESTDDVVQLDTKNAPPEGVEARVWVGVTDSNVPVRALVVVVREQTNDPRLLAVFERERQELIAAPRINSVVPDVYDGIYDDDLGPCCMCETLERVNVVVALYRRCPIPGHGWGCSICQLPKDGAVAVLCDPCQDRYLRDESLLTQVCRGHPATEGRIPIEELPPGEFDHDPQVGGSHA
jgi:hypothetical protein